MLTTDNKVIIILMTIALITITGSAAASSPRMIGLGNEFVTITGPNALYGNPAAVNAADNKFTLDISFDNEFWNNLFMNDIIDESEKEKMLNNIQDTGWLININGKANAVITAGPAAGFVGLKMDGLIKLPYDAGEAVLEGISIKEYNLDGVKGKGGIYGDAGINLSLKTPDSYAESLNMDNLYAGITLHYLHGMIIEADGSGNIEYNFADDGGANYSGEGELLIKYTEDRAQGFAFDCGIYGNLDEKTSVGVSVLNYGRMTANTFNYLKYDSDNPEEPEEGTLQKEITWNLPLRIKIGAEHQYQENILLLADYTHTTYDPGLQDSKFSFGSEFTWSKTFPLRLGLNYSTLQNDFDLTAGMSINMGPFKIDAGVSDLLGLFHKSKGLRYGISTGISF